MKKSLGFSLIELMITIAIVIILAGVGVPSYQSTIHANKVDTTRELLRAAISYGKNTAIAQNRPIIMQLENNTLTFSMNPSDAASTINKITLDPSQDTKISYKTNAQDIEFRANGTLATVNKINHCFAGTMVTFEIKLTGETEETRLNNVKC